MMIEKYSINAIVAAPNFDEVLAEYAAESAIDGLPPPCADIETYKKLETAGSLHPIAAFLGDHLVGFIFVLISKLPHYSADVAIVESFFVAKKHRKTGAGIKLRHAAEAFANKAGACGLLMSAPVGGTLSKVLPHSGYTETNQVFFRKLSNV